MQLDLGLVFLFPLQGKGDGVRIERSGLHDNWDDAEGYYSKCMTNLSHFFRLVMVPFR